ncbi:MAG: hypothetical protein HKP61_22950 [Dactylosporangium sp.]|nr:PIG-L family deacetylase [Dactylosporangium sp.]NNJ63737.1 hypothetical protein [Dactylosporangium sp.]
MNPDIYQSIRSGMPTVTVYVTASEISGNGDTPEQKARSLQRGVEDAYARMAGVPDVDPTAQEEWTGQSWTIGTRQVERYSLLARPDVQLVFMNLHDARLGEVYDEGLTDTTVIPADGTVTSSYSYTKSDVVDVIASMISSYQPTVLRLQDTIPDARYWPDHVDHFATARFTTDAAARYPGRLAQVTYRNYNITDVPANLTDDAAAAKESFFEAYRPYDDFATPLNWLDRMYYRWPTGTRWVTRTADGRPQAFVVRNGEVTTLWQAADGSWSGPLVLGDTGGAVVPAVVAVTNTDGTLQVFARRLLDHHLITARQSQPDGTWPATWTDLGNPNLDFGGPADQVGVPAVTANADGSLWLFVKDGGGGVCGKRQHSAGGTWGGWIDLLGGADVQAGGLATIRSDDGLVWLFASTRDGVLTWRQDAPNGDLLEDGMLPTLDGAVPASPPSVTKNHDGTLEVLYREAGTTSMITTFQAAGGASWVQTPVRLGGHGGIGQPALLTAPPGDDARIMVFERNDDTGVSMTKQGAPDSPYESWVDLGGTIVDYPAATINATDAVVVFAIGADANLYVRQQVTAGANSAFGAWQVVG